MVSFLSSWVFLSPFFLWTTNFNILHLLAHYVFVEFGGGEKILSLELCFPPQNFLPWRFCSHHSIYLHLYMDVNYPPLKHFSRIYSL